MKITILLLAAMLLPGFAWAQPTPADIAAPETITDDDDSAQPDAFEDIGEGVEDIGAGIKEIKAAGGDRMALAFGIALLLSGIFKILLAVAKRWGSAVFKKPDVLRVICAVLGLLLFIAGSIVPGVNWWEALIVGLSGPGAVLVTEFGKIIVKTKKP